MRRLKHEAPSFQLHVLLISLGRKAQSAIKKLIQQAQQFHFAVNFDRAAPEALPLQKFPEMFLSHRNCPAEVGKRYALGGAALTEFKIAPLDVVDRLGEQPSLRCCKISSICRRNSSTGTLRRSLVRGYVPSFVTSSAASSFE